MFDIYDFANQLNEKLEKNNMLKEENEYLKQKVKFIFKHKKDKDIQSETYTIGELIFGVGETKQPVRDIIGFWNEDGYVLLGISEDDYI